jgi:hypothetical protein
MTHYVGPGPWGPGEGALSVAKFDANNHGFETRITDLETSPPQPNDIVAITLTGSFLSMTQRDGTILGPVPFSPPMARWRAEWTVSTAYVAFDFVTVTGVGLYGVLRDHTSDDTAFDENATNVDGDALYRKVMGFSGTTAMLSDLIDVRALSASDGAQLVYNNSDPEDPFWEAVRARYIIGASSGGTMTADQNLLFHRFTKDVTIPADFGAYLGHESQAGGSVNATADTVITVSKADNATPTTFASVGTITIGAGGVSPTFDSSATTILFEQGDVLRLRAPASPDATLSDFFCSLVGFET